MTLFKHVAIYPSWSRKQKLQPEQLQPQQQCRQRFHQHRHSSSSSVAAVAVTVAAVAVLCSSGPWMQVSASPVFTSSSDCPAEQLAQYRVELNTHWSREEFPKHYPPWRPHAQWTKLLGVSHASEFSVFREGALSSEGLKEFVETGRSDRLDATTYASQGAQVLDGFYAPAITQGVGTTQAEFFVDGNHSRVSMVAKIVPSPDWFIGVDSLQLCSSGHWLNATSIQLSPMDAGTDQGLSFSSPSWQLVPPDPITRITNKSPSHPAASFSYPEKSSLPSIASLSIVKVKEYRLVKPSSVKVPLRVYDSTGLLRDDHDGPLSSTTERLTKQQRDHYLPEQSEQRDQQPQQHQQRQLIGQRIKDVSSVPKSVASSFDHSRASGESLPTMTTTKPLKHSQDALSLDRPYIASNEITRSSSPAEVSRGLPSTSERSSLYTLNMPSHDSPTTIDDNSPRPYSGEISVSHSSYDTLTSSREILTLADDHDPISNDVSDAAVSNEIDSPAPERPYNEVLPREQYDRETEQQMRRQQALDHHQKMQQLLEEKRKKLKEKKRKHRERKLAASRAQRGEDSEVEEPGLRQSRRRQHKITDLRVIPKGDAMSVIDNIVETYQRDQRRKRRQQRREERRRTRMLNRLNGVPPKRGKQAVDCAVAEWSTWSPCSKTCGIGEQVRTREVTQHPRRGGIKCPAVKETTWCGSARDCHRDYFKW